MGSGGVRVNGVVPGPIEGTEGFARLAPTEDDRAHIIASVPLRRYGTPRDVANVCRFLASPLASYVSGVVVAADGGGHSVARRAQWLPSDSLFSTK